MALPDSPLAGYLSGNRRLYAQLRPDPESLTHLIELQQELAGLPEINDGGRPRWVSGRRMHLTLIHFGKVRDVYSLVSVATGIAWDLYEELLAGYVAETEAAMPRQPVVLEPADSMVRVWLVSLIRSSHLPSSFCFCHWYWTVE